jgi:hypothetical protein
MHTLLNLFHAGPITQPHLFLPRSFLNGSMGSIGSIGSMGSAGLTKTPMKMGSAKMTTMQKPKMKILKHFRL